jgi:hypothetical protein
LECLVDGIGVLEHGGEFPLNEMMEPVLPLPREGWVPIVHFDLKPDNSKKACIFATCDPC